MSAHKHPTVVPDGGEQEPDYPVDRAYIQFADDCHDEFTQLVADSLRESDFMDARWVADVLVVKEVAGPDGE